MLDFTDEEMEDLIYNDPYIREGAGWWAYTHDKNSEGYEGIPYYIRLLEYLLRMCDPGWAHPCYWEKHLLYYRLLTTAPIEELPLFLNGHPYSRAIAMWRLKLGR